MNLTLQTIPSTVVSELLANTSIDGVVLDTEHGVFNNETLFNCIQIVTSLGKRCFVRVTHLDKQLVRMCLDSGCTGLIFSTVESKQQARDIIDYCSYPNHGGSRGCGLVRENNWDVKNLASKKPIIIAQIETKTAIDNLDDILLPDFNFYIVGPYDVSNSLGCPAQWDDDLYKQSMNKINGKIPSSKLGMFIVTKSDIESYDGKSLGVRIWGMDALFIRDSITEIINRV